MTYDYRCDICDLDYEISKSVKDAGREEKCQYCAKALRRIFTVPSVVGTRDTFGIGRKFIHTNKDGTKKEITNNKEWEKAGYSNPLDSPRLSSDMKAQVKEKIRKVTKKPVSFAIGG